MHALVDSRAMPMVYVLLQSKTQADYERVFRKLTFRRAFVAQFVNAHLSTRICRRDFVCALLPARCCRRAFILRVVVYEPFAQVHVV